MKVRCQDFWRKCIILLEFNDIYTWPDNRKIKQNKKQFIMIYFNKTLG